MGIVPPTTEPADKHMEEFFKEVSLIKVASSLPPGVGRERDLEREGGGTLSFTP